MTPAREKEIKAAIKSLLAIIPRGCYIETDGGEKEIIVWEKKSPGCYRGAVTVKTSKVKD